MSFWYSFVITGFAFALDSLLDLYSGRETKTIDVREQKIKAVVRALAGVLVMVASALIIQNGLLASDITVAFTKEHVWEYVFYSLSTAGTFRILVGFFIIPPLRFFKVKAAKAEDLKFGVGVVLFLSGGLLLSALELALVPLLVWVFSSLGVLLMYVFIRMATRESNQEDLQPAESNK